MERLCALYGYRRIQTPGFEDTELFQRTSGAGSDIVQKEMYTFEDRERPLADAAPGGHGADLPRVHRARHAPRAAAGEALHDRADVPLRGAAARALPRALPALAREHRLRRSCGRRRGASSSTTRCSATSASTQYELQLNSIGDRNCRPAYLEQLNAWLDEHADVLDDDARQKRATSPLRVFDVKNEQVRAALQDAPKIGESLCDECARALRAGARAARRVRRRVHARPDARARPRLLHAHDVRVPRPGREHAGSTICGGGRYDYLVEEIGGDPTPGIGFGAGIERLDPLARARGRRRADEPQLDLYFVVDDAAHRGERARRDGRAARAQASRCDTDYAGRSLKGQLTQAQKRAAAVAIRTSDGWTVRRRGEQDRERARH